MTAVNYRNEPLGLRVRDPVTNQQTAGLPGDLSFAYQSRTDRADTAFNSQPEVLSAAHHGPQAGDPFTPLLRAFEGDQIKVRTLVGAHEESHNFTIHGVKWLFEPRRPNSGYRNSQMTGISEWFDFEIPRVLQPGRRQVRRLPLQAERRDRVAVDRRLGPPARLPQRSFQRARRPPGSR